MEELGARIEAAQAQRLVERAQAAIAPGRVRRGERRGGAAPASESRASLGVEVGREDKGGAGATSYRDGGGGDWPGQAFDEARGLVVQLRRLSPEHPWVCETQEKIRTAQAQRLIEEAEAAIGRDAFDEARGLVEQLADLSPEHPKVWELKEGITKKLTPEMVRIEGGCFRIGSPESEMGRSRRRGAGIEVCVETFSIGTHEVTFAEYDRFADATGRSRPDDSRAGAAERRPVINVSWDDATAYARWLSE